MKNDPWKDKKRLPGHFPLYTVEFKGTIAMSDNTEKKQGTKFQKGQSGNPKGRPKGSLNKTTLACQELLDGEAEAITRTAVEMAKAGETTALRLCMERLVPPRKERVVCVDLPAIDKDADFPKFTGALLDAVASGEITISEAQGLLELATNHRKGLAFGKSLFDWE